ncbi:MAG: hypothetical protein CL797_09570 [Chromatiales bacterium]|jgi:hypothetical protein|nr:hypothetical protein [Chromatiales bacterium]
MPAQHTNLFKRGGFAVAVVAFGSTIAFAQEDIDEPADKDKVVEELVVYANKKSGDPVDVEALYEKMLRERLMLEQDSMRLLEEENAWRSSGSTTVDESSRIQWGYSPQDELRMRRESNLPEMPGETTKPATMFRVGF